MSDDARRIFPMETALNLVANKGGAEVLDFLGYAVQAQIGECCRPAVAPVVKGWLYSLNPDFMKSQYDEGASYGVWINEQKQRLGDSISLSPMPAHEIAGITALLDSIKAAKETAVEKTAAAEAAQAEAKAMAPFKTKSADLEKKLAQVEEKNKTLTAEVADLKKQLAAFTGKIAIDEKDIEKSVKDMVSKAVKEALASLPVGAVVASAAGVADAPAGFGDAAGSTDSSGAVPDTFGFGASGASEDGFGF